MQVLGRWGLMSNMIYSEMIDYRINSLLMSQISSGHLDLRGVFAVAEILKFWSTRLLLPFRLHLV